MRAGERTFIYENKPSVLGCAGVAGKDEKEGPLGAHFDVFFDDDLWGEKTWELTERKMFLMAVQTAIFRASLKNADINFLFGGDLLNQIISAGFAARELKIPFFGLYGACSTMAESLILGALAVDGGYAENVVCATSSHFATAERQYRYPLELGTPKTPTSQHTATASGATVLGKGGKIAVTSATVGRVVDYGIADGNNMGAAMAPAAAETLLTHFEDTGRTQSYYDVIVTGDLGTFGKSLMPKITGLELKNYTDCGAELYKGMPNMYCGASGCGCSALLLNQYYLPKMFEGEINKLLFMATGALLSPTSSMQGESVPSIAHAVSIERV